MDAVMKRCMIVVMDYSMSCGCTLHWTIFNNLIFIHLKYSIASLCCTCFELQILLFLRLHIYTKFSAQERERHS